MSDELNPTEKKAEPQTPSSQPSEAESSGVDFGEKKGDAAEPRAEQPHLPNLRTYQDDIAEALRKGASLASIAVAEAEKQKGAPTEKGANPLRPLFIWGSVALIVLSLLVVAETVYFFLQKEGNAPVTNEELLPAEYIFVEKRENLPVDGLQKEGLLSLLKNKVDGTGLALGGIAQYYLTTGEGEGRRLLEASEFLSLLGAPSGIASALGRDFFFGVHVFDGNVPILIFKTSFYQSAFAGLLDWEETVQRDFAPAFGEALKTTELFPTATSSVNILSDSPFEDRVIENKDVRLLRNHDGSVVFLYSFIDHETLLITTSEKTFSEVLRRLTTARLRS